MSDPIAVSILAKLTSWYSFEGNLNDSKGGNNLSTGAIVAGYGAGKKGQMVLKNSRAASAIAAPFQLTTDNAIFIGGWVYYDGTADARTLFGLSFDLNATNAAFGVGVNAAGAIRANGYVDGSNLYGVEVPGFTVKTYDLLFQAEDANGNFALSPQTVQIGGNPPANGFYFVLAQFRGQVIEVNLNGQFVGKSTPPMPAPVRSTPVSYFQIGQQFGGSNTNCGLDEVFFGHGQLLNTTEIAWLYNAGAGRSYAEIVGLAA